MPISSLPAELLVAIAEQLDVGPWNRWNLYRFCLVSRGWHKAATNELYRVVTYEHYQSRGAQLARTMKARPDLAKAVRHFIVILPSSRDLDKHLLHLTTTLQCTASIMELTITSESVPAPVLAALVASPPLLDLEELNLCAPLRNTRDFTQFTALLATCTPLCRLHFQGAYFYEGMPPAELHRLREAAKRHALTSLDIGIACSDDALEIFASHSYATLQRLRLEISVSPEPFHLSSLTGLRTLDLHAGYSEGGKDLTVYEASMRARELLSSCKALPNLSSLILDLNWRSEYDLGGFEGPDSAGDYIIDIETLHNLPPSLSTLEINDSLVNADDFLTFLDSIHRPPSLVFVKTDLYTGRFQSSKLKTVLRRLHSLGIRYEITPYEVYVYGHDNLAYTYNVLKDAEPVLEWDGGEWTEPDIPSEDESEGASDGEESDSGEGEEGGEGEEE